MTTRKVYTEELEALHQKVIHMGGIIEESLEMVIRALKEMNQELAQEIVQRDDQVDTLEREVEKECISIIARQQPVATDLRRVTSILRIVSDLERIADHCQDISEYILLLAAEERVPSPAHVEEMVEKVREMIRRTAEAFVNDNEDEARAVMASDDAVDDYFVQIRDELAVAMKHNPDRIKQYIDYLMIIKYLERMADHSTNIAEWICYVVTGDLEAGM